MKPVSVGRVALTLLLSAPGCFPSKSPIVVATLPDGGPITTPAITRPSPNNRVANKLDPPYDGVMNPKWVMELSGGSPGPHVDHGTFWPDATEVGSAWWEAWIMAIPDRGGYFLSDGYGGGHAMLIGTNGDGTIGGNMWGGPEQNNNASFVSQTLDKFAEGEWFHVAVAYERTRAQAVLVYINGILSGYTPRPHGRWSFPAGGGAGNLYVGGSTHQNFGGRIAWMRGFDNDVFPRDPDKFLTAFRPRREVSPTEHGPGTQRGVMVPNGTFHADFLASYAVPPGTKIIPDLALPPADVRSPPRVTTTHPGKAEHSVVEAIEKLPIFVEDPTLPLGPGPQPPRVQTPVVPLKLPYAAKIFDSFGRANQDFTLDTEPTLGETEGGSLGIVKWQTEEGQPFGIRNSNAVFLGTKDLSPAWTDCGTGDQDVEIFHAGVAGHSLTGGAGVVFRMLDPKNLWIAFVSAPLTVTVRKIVNGQPTDFGPFPMPATWFANLNVRAQGKVIQVFADKADGTVEEIATLTDDFNANATKVGFASAAGSFPRVKSFLLQAYPR